MELNSYIEHTNLESTATLKEIQNLCEEAKKYHFASICISPFYVAHTKELLKDSNVQIATTVGYPSGSHTKEAKVYEAIDAITNGADEIAMQINTSMIKNKDYDAIKEEIEEIRDAIDGKTLKVSINPSVLTEDEIIKITEICNSTFIHFIEIYIEDNWDEKKLEAIVKHKNEILEIQVTGKIKDEKKVEMLIKNNVSKIGTKNSVKIMKEGYHESI